MTENILLKCPVILRRQAYDLFFTEDRIHLLPLGQSDGAFFLPLTSIIGHQVNKLKDGVKEQKTLIKISCKSESGETVDRVFDFTGDEASQNQKKVDELLRNYSGDKAADREISKQRLLDSLAIRRARFLTDRPALALIYESLVENEKTVTADEFWTRYQSEVECYAAESGSSDTHLTDRLTIPVPLRAPERPKSIEVGGREILITIEKAREIFSQYPQALELFNAAVPHALTEKDFWRRFFQCQFFWKSQGSEHESCRDPIFDALSRKEEESRVFFSSLPISPEIDLCPDWLGETRRDNATTTELGGAAGSAASEAYGELAKRFNAFGSSLVINAPIVKDVEQISEIRRSKLVGEDAIPIETRNDQQPELSKLLHSYQIDRKPTEKWSEIYRNFQVPTVRHTPGMPGIDAATMELTTAMVPLTRNGDNTSKKLKKMETDPRNLELEVFADKISEVLRNIWESDGSEVEKRDRLIHSIATRKVELENWLARAGPEWSMAVRGLLAPMERAERVSRMFKKIIVAND